MKTDTVLFIKQYVSTRWNGPLGHTWVTSSQLYFLRISPTFHTFGFLQYLIAYGSKTTATRDICFFVLVRNACQHYSVNVKRPWAHKNCFNNALKKCIIFR